MRKQIFQHLIVIVVVLVLSLLIGAKVQAGSKKMVAGKREAFKEDSVESMGDVFKRSESENEAYREKMISNSRESIRLLKEIRDLLKQLNEKE